ncbi:hypothetical protein SAMN05660841_03811 [Sphingobacterium nematocida]|uniref:Uncharacterized protein n=1 Tax=Sphingobacterium nematocida TaxID=1513896 RepID=A0A1T5G7H7_9SPHI|nr:DUF6263 family protein [Sphingobacterium nematocida]SKC04281.1 hypothetical protein SAMN05660841_03811 [Sphingobacterium nematocida]
MKRLFTTLFVASTIVISTQAQEKITFKLNPEKGKVIPIEMIMKSDIEGAQNMIMDMTMRMNMTATEVTESSAKYEAKYTQVKTDINAGIVTISYDSSKEPSNQMEEMMATQMKPLLENTLSITMDKNAKVLAMDFPNVPAEAFDRSSIQGMSVAFPDKPLSIGDSWENELSLAQLGAKGKNVNTFAGKTAEGYKINITGTYTDNAGTNIGTSTGYYILDPNTFFTTHSVVNTVIEVQGNKISSSIELKEIK